MQLNTNDRDALLRLAERATEVAAWAEPRDPWERSRIEAALQELAEELRAWGEPLTEYAQGLESALGGGPDAVQRDDFRL